MSKDGKWIDIFSVFPLCGTFFKLKLNLSPLATLCKCVTNSFSIRTNVCMNAVSSYTQMTRFFSMFKMSLLLL